MALTDTPVVRFLRAMTLQDSTTETTAYPSPFADLFMAVNPQGVQCVRAADFAFALPKRKQLFASQGHRSTIRLSVDETTLDASHVLAKTLWRFAFDRSVGDPVEIDVNSTFILETSAGSMKVLFYLNSQDPITLQKQQKAPCA